MVEDYRNTKYCPVLSNLLRKKQNVKNEVLKVHPKAKDMHTYLSDNQTCLKKLFANAYNWKCAYCGVSVAIIPMRLFEIDHLIPKESARFCGSKANAGRIENLVLSCSYCNRAKSRFECSEENLTKIHPDTTEILKSFVRDGMYYIRIRDDRQKDTTIRAFYEKVKLGSQLHRIDYLLMNMLGLCNYMEGKGCSCESLRKAIELLKTKRNVMG